MNRIGVVTFWSSYDNYGQVLQCYALQQQLKKLGYDPFLIRYERPETHKILSTSEKLVKVLTIVPLLRKAKKIYQMVRDAKKATKLVEKNKLRQFDRFREENISMSSEIYHSISELRDNPPKADCYICGSDSIWAQLLNNEENKAFFLDFGDGKTPKVAYAASFLMRAYPEEMKNDLKAMLNNFKAISIRESEGVAICKQLGIDAIQCCDPTLLLQKEDYQNLMVSNTTSTNEEYVYIYSVNVYHRKQIRWNEIKKLCDESQINIKVTVGSGIYPGYEIYGKDVNYDYCSIERWIRNINNAKFFVTSSYHGVVFAIIMETPFVYIPFSGESDRLNGRIIDLLSETGLTNRMLGKNISYSELLQQEIDWNNVKASLEKVRNSSIEFIKNSLCK